MKFRLVDGFKTEPINNALVRHGSEQLVITLGHDELTSVNDRGQMDGEVVWYHDFVLPPAVAKSFADAIYEHLEQMQYLPKEGK